MLTNSETHFCRTSEKDMDTFLWRGPRISGILDPKEEWFLGSGGGRVGQDGERL